MTFTICKNYFILLVLFVLILNACASSEAAGLNSTSKNATDQTTIEVEQVVSEAQPVVFEGSRRVVGSFRSVQGVMDPLSCYCSNGGYVESPAGEVVPVCFDNATEISNTDYIEITGAMTTRSIEANGACSSGTLSYLVVESYNLEP